MNVKSINKIKRSDVWRRMKKNPHYLADCVVKDRGCHALYVFFSSAADGNLIQDYFTEGQSMGVGETLSYRQPERNYHWVITFS